MKKKLLTLRSSIMGLAFLLLMLFTFASVDAQTNQVIGTWRLDIHEAIAHMAVTHKTRFDTLPADVKTRVTSQMDNREFIFSQDGSIRINWQSSKGPQVSEGQWILNGTPGKLSITINNYTTLYDFEFPVQGVMILQMDSSGGLLDNLYLEKAN